MRIYLDACCLCRPFDDQSQIRIHLEAEAVALIELYFEIGHWEWISSEVVEWEVTRTENAGIREELEILSSLASRTVKVQDAIVSRSRYFEKWSIKGMDALHFACAEAGKVDVFLSTDDHLLKRAKGHQKELGFKVVNPLESDSEHGDFMKAKVLSSEEIRVRGLRLLGKELGPYNFVRFIQQYKTGRGDHTKGRHVKLDKISVEDIYKEIKARRKHL